MRIRTIPVTEFSQNARIFYDEHASPISGGNANYGASIIVDPGGEIGAILESFKGLAPLESIRGIFLTHAHLDHAGGVATLMDELVKLFIPRPKLYANGIERGLRGSIAAQAALFGLNTENFRNCPEPDVLLEEGDNLEIGSVSGKILFTPGHSPGHLSVFFSKREYQLEIMGAGGKIVMESHKIEAPLLLGGDALFQGSIGRTDLPGGNFEQLIENISKKIFTLPDETRVLTGHGPDTEVGIEKRTNPFFHA